jgi:methionine-rich copper-binding protein CopC
MLKTHESVRVDARARHARVWLAGPMLGLALALVVMLFPAIASAHAYYVSSDPKSGGVVTKAPTLVTVNFAENVNPQGSDIVIYDSTHKQVSTAPATVLTSKLKTMTVPMTGDGDGIYLVEWHTVSADDGATDIGGFTFTVSASGKVDPSAGPAATPATTTSGGSSGVPAWLTILVGVIALVVGGGGGYYAARRVK